MSTQAISLEEYWTIDQVASRVHVSPETVKKWLTNGLLPRTKAGKRTLVTETDLQAFIRKSTLQSSGIDE